MIRVHEIKIRALEQFDALPAKVEKRLHIPAGSVKSFKIAKESIDARQKPDIYKIYSLDIESDKSDEWLLRACERQNVRAEQLPAFRQAILPSAAVFAGRPVIAGFGPCGMFCALALAKMGARPIVLERGPSMEDRVQAVEHFWRTGELDPEANCQFGEGGAGTFSDGKLTTGTKSEYQRFVLEEFAAAGAHEDILYKQKPHIGTDVLRTVVVNIRKEIEALGGEVRFNTALSAIEIKDSQISAVMCRDGSRLETSCLVLALGHSARDTVRYLYGQGLDMQQKQFSMGVRIEHPQELIDRAQYGAPAGSLGLGPSDYKLNVKTKDGRGVYTFCMCPGGEVVNASSAEGCVTCNGMSSYKRDSGRANSALLADVRTSDFGSDYALAGVEFQEKYEKLAFVLGGGNYQLPREQLSDFMKNSMLRKCLPDFVYEALREAIPMLGRKLKGFDDPSALMYALESRSSSPVRMVRNECGFAMRKNEPLKGVYPAGEGAGYAGGIMSAACDGVRIAVKIAESGEKRSL